jgi:hypothetical protein
MTTHRLTKTIALVLIALVACSGVADAKRKKRKPVKKKPVAAAIQAPTTRSWVSSAIVTVLSTGAFPGVTGDTIDPDGVLDGPSLTAFVMAAQPKAAKKVRQIPAGQPVTLGDVDQAFVAAAGLDVRAADHAGPVLGPRPR